MYHMRIWIIIYYQIIYTRLKYNKLHCNMSCGIAHAIYHLISRVPNGSSNGLVLLHLKRRQQIGASSSLMIILVMMRRSFFILYSKARTVN